MKIKEFLSLIVENGFKIIPNWSNGCGEIQGQEWTNLKEEKISQALQDLEKYAEIDEYERHSKVLFFQDDLHRHIPCYLDDENGNFDCSHSSFSSLIECDSGFCNGKSSVLYRAKNNTRFCQRCFRVIYAKMTVYGFWRPKKEFNNAM